MNADQREQIREWVKQYPKNLNKIIGLVRDEFNLDVSKDTIKRILKALQFSWRRIRKIVKGKPDPQVYAARKAALAKLIAEDNEGIIDLRYFDESGFCLIPYVPYAWQNNGEIIGLTSGHSPRLNVLGFMNKNNDLEAYCFECSVTSEVVVGCFDDFCKALQSPTVVLVDNASIHRSEAPRPKGGASSGRWAPQKTPCSDSSCPSSEEGISIGGISPKPPKTNPVETHPAPHADDSGCIASPLLPLPDLPLSGQNTRPPRALVVCFALV